MTRRNQRAAVLADLPADWENGFTVFPGKRKLTCLTCGAQGWPGDGKPNPWQLDCIAGHPEHCDTCGARFHKGGLSRHRGSTKGQCLLAPATNHRRLQHLLIERERHERHEV